MSIRGVFLLASVLTFSVSGIFFHFGRVKPGFALLGMACAIGALSNYL